MFNLNLEIENFLAIKKANLESKNNITVLIAPNRAGKTQLMQMLYTVLWSLWRELHDRKHFTLYHLRSKIKNVFLLRKINELHSWDSETFNFSLSVNNECRITVGLEEPHFEKLTTFDEAVSNFRKVLTKSPIYLQPAGLGDYYKGIYSLKKYYPKWQLISEAVTDLVSDLFIVADEKVEPTNENQKLMELFEKLFSSKFYIQNRRIYIQEKGKRYGIERTASGLKSLSWFYLILRYNLLGNILFVDEPEVNLHPEYIDKFTYFVYRLSQKRKIFIATHSDYLLESINKLMNRYDFKVDVWEGILEENYAYYDHYEADKENLIDTTPLNEVYRRIIKELFEYDGEIEL